MLIIYAHPNKDGHCGHILQEAEKKLKAEKLEYLVLDLYEMNYNPVLKPEEHYTSGHRDFGEDTKKMQAIIQKEDKLLIIYPTWWNGTPSILKGFFDRVLVSGFGFRYENSLSKGLLKGKKAIVFTTAGGPVFYQKLFAGNRSLQTVVKDTLNFCGIKAKGFLIGSANKLTEGNKRKIEKAVEMALKWLG